MYHSMAMFLAKILHIRPHEILTEWSVPELIVTYGEYANQKAQQNLADWKALDTKQRIKTERPPEYIVKFIGVI